MADAASTPPAATRWPPFLRALGYRDFRLFFIGQGISLVGTWMQTVAESWLVYRLTGSAALLGTVGFCGMAPIALLAPVAGLAADRLEKRKVLLATQTGSLLLALALAALTLTGTVKVWMILVLATLLGVANAFDLPVRQAFFVEMVGREDLINAIALNSSLFNAARVAGPALAGLLVAAVGEGWCFALNAASYLAVIAGYFRMTARGLPGPLADRTPGEFILEGFRFCWRERPIRALLALISAACLFGTAYNALMPVIADRVLHGGARGYGWLMAALGVGALGGALSLAVRAGLKGLGGVAAWTAAAFGLAVAAFALSTNFYLSLALVAGVGFGLMGLFGAVNTLLQTMAPDRLRGRVMAAYSMAFSAAVPLGALAAGALADRFGAPRVLAAGGLLTALSGLAFFRVLPSIRGPARDLIREAMEEPAA